MFADDSLLFFQAEVEQARSIKHALSLYENSTGQLINPSKCSLLFSGFCPVATQEEIKGVLQVQSASFEEKYLGLPTPDGRMKATQFQPLGERLSKRMTNWNEKYMSAGAKDVLIKSVAQALPTYTMGMFKMSDKFCEEYSQLVRNFWWGHDKGERKVHWISWEKLTSPKTFGGMGFRDIKCFNQALLARQAWRLLTMPDSLCARILKAKYYPHGNLLDTAFPSVSSPTWKAIEHGLQLLKDGVIWRIGNGTNIKIWRHRWIPKGDKSVVPRKNNRNRLLYVNELLNPGTKEWNERLVRHVMKEEDATETLRMNLSDAIDEDFPAWQPERTGMFTVKSAYRLAWNLKQPTSASSSSEADGERKIWRCLWKTNVQPKVKIFAWKLAHDRLPTWENKRKRKIEQSGIFPICAQTVEDGFHATVECTKARALREGMREIWKLPGEECFARTGPDWLLVLLDASDDAMRAHVLYLLWRS